MPAVVASRSPTRPWPWSAWASDRYRVAGDPLDGDALSEDSGSLAGPGNGNGGPPDLEEIIRRSQDRFKRMLPGGFNGGVEGEQMGLAGDGVDQSQDLVNLIGGVGHRADGRLRRYHDVDRFGGNRLRFHDLADDLAVGDACCELR